MRRSARDISRVSYHIANRRLDSEGILSLPASHSAKEFRISLALHIISLLEEIPSSLGTRCLQPIVMIIAASELHFSPSSMQTFPMDVPFESNTFASSAYVRGSPTNTTAVLNSITNFEVDIASARRFVVTRFQDFRMALPAKPMTNT